MADPEGGEFCAFLRDPAELPAYRLHGIGIDAVDARAQAAWWGNVFGVAPVNEEGQDWHTLEHATPDPVLTLDFAPVPEPRVGPNRVHWDVTGDVDALLAAGATRLWDMPDWTVLADPEGNEFCVFPPEAEPGLISPAARRRVRARPPGWSAPPVARTSRPRAPRPAPRRSTSRRAPRRPAHGARPSRCRSLTCTSATSAARRLRNQSGSRGEPEPVPHTTSPSAVSR